VPRSIPTRRGYAARSLAPHDYKARAISFSVAGYRARRDFQEQPERRYTRTFSDHTRDDFATIVAAIVAGGRELLRPVLVCQIVRLGDGACDLLGNYDIKNVLPAVLHTDAVAFAAKIA
jgi:hypothetical protein